MSEQTLMTVYKKSTALSERCQLMY